MEYTLWDVLFSSDDPGEAVFLSLTSVALSAVMMVVGIVITVLLKLGLHWQLIVGSLRCLVQLGMLGYVLVPIFTYGERYWSVTLAYALFMVLAATLEAQGRPAYLYQGMFFDTLSSVVSASGVAIVYALAVVMPVQPWWDPQYTIPVLGMILGNVINAISVGLATLLNDIADGTDRIEVMLAFGATATEACAVPVRRSLRVALMPLVNQLTVVGLVSIPGMMTGQILSGSDPTQAARYQMVIMFLLTGAASGGSACSVYLALHQLFDTQHRLCIARLKQRERHNNGLQKAFAAGIAQLWRCFTWRRAPPDTYAPLPGAATDPER